MKGKCIFGIAIVITLAVLAVAALVCSLPEIPADEIPERKTILEAGSVMEPGNVMEPANTAESGQNTAEGFPPSLKGGVSPQGAMKILIFLFGMGNIIFMQIKNENMLRFFMRIAYTLAVTFSFGKWSIYMACLERGYEAAGGEYCFIFVVGWAAGMAIDHFFDTLEDFKYERAYRKEIG